MTENQTDLQPTKEKQEKALTLFCVRGEPQLPAVRAVSGLSIDAVLPWETIR
jgi:hypothetical protein